MVVSIETKIKIRIAEIVAISIAEVVAEIGTVEDETIVGTGVVVMIGTVVAGETSETMKASGTSGQAAGEAMIGTTLATVVAVIVVAMKGLCPKGCESWPGRTLVSSSSVVATAATMDSSSLVAEGTSVVVAITT